MVTVNGYSNIHNTSWSRGLLSTLSISFVFFVLLQISIHKENIFNYKLNTGKILGEFINFINPTHSIDYFVRSNSGDFTLFIDLISRVFIGYCIYQTVQAFRIYGKNV